MSDNLFDSDLNDIDAEIDFEWYRESRLPHFDFDNIEFPEDDLSRVKDETDTSKPKKKNVKSPLSSVTSASANSLTGSLNSEGHIEDMLSSLIKKNRRKLVEPRGQMSVHLFDVLSGETCKISCLKSKEEKVALVNEAIERADCNLLTTAILFAKSTLSPHLFHREILKRSEAEDAYINYLRTTGLSDQLLDFLTMTGRHEEAAITKLKQTLSVSGVETRIRMLRQCKQNLFNGSDILEFWGQLIEDEATLLERQLPIEEEDKRIENQPTSEYNAKFLEIPRKPLVDLPVITTLFYCCLYHWDLPENYLPSPASLRKTFNLSERQFVSTALSALSMRKRWDLVDGLLQNKSWLGIRKSRLSLQPEEIARTLIKYQAPQEVVNKYVFMISDQEARIAFAEQYNLQKVLKASRRT